MKKVKIGYVKYNSRRNKSEKKEEYIFNRYIWRYYNNIVRNYNSMEKFNIQPELFTTLPRMWLKAT